MNIKRKTLNRRQFLQGSAKTVGAALALPTIITSNALGGRGGISASERVVFGTIGIGGRGRSDLRNLMGNDDAIVIAHCNCYRPGRESIKATIDAQYSSDIPTYIDFRELLARPDIDAVLSTTGDKNHAMISVHAMRAGKDNYSEKPGTMTIQEGQVLLETQNRYGRVFQSGAQRMNQSNFIFANELVRLGRLGEVKTFVADLALDTIERTPYMNFPSHEPDVDEPSKEDFWWDAWLGANPWMPYHSRFSSGSHNDGYGYMYYYNGNIGEWGSHTHPQAMDAMQTTNTGPIEIIFPNNTNGEGLRLIFTDGREMVLRQGLSPRTCAVQYEGSEGWTGVGDGGLDVRPQSLMADYDTIVNNYRERTQRRGDHMRDLLDCIKSRRLATTHAEVAHRSMSSVHIANICMWLRRDMRWDPDKEEFINDEAANRLRSRAQREPWAFV
ncbi:Gfo/Idh/MocA family oxidoreductase [Planctomycetota bacterium]